MPSDMRSISFIFHRNDGSRLANTKTTNPSKSHLRRRLQDKFDNEASNCSGSKDKSWHNISQDSKRVLRNGAVRITKTWSNVRLTFDTISQKFKTSTKRCHRLDEQFTPGHNSNLQTPQTRSRDLLGRTPTKLYSPFGIESPVNWDKDLENTPAHAIPKVYQTKSQRFFKLFKEKSFYGLH